MPSSDVDFHINAENPLAVYIQIENQFRFGVTSGRIQPGQALPSVREISERLHVNPNTVTKAYRDLELLGLLYSRRGVGVTVTENAPNLCRDSTIAMVKEHLRCSIAQCVATGLDNAAIQEVVDEALASGAKPYEPCTQ